MAPKREWIFTFGINHKHSGKFVRIFGTYDDAREVMFLMHSDAWGFQYPDEDAAGVAKYNLEELK